MEMCARSAFTIEVTAIQNKIICVNMAPWSINYSTDPRIS